VITTLVVCQSETACCFWIFVTRKEETKKPLYLITEFTITSDAYVHIFRYRQYMHYMDLNLYAVDLAILCYIQEGYFFIKVITCMLLEVKNFFET
jgi:hypothetical protein